MELAQGGPCPGPTTYYHLVTSITLGIYSLCCTVSAKCINVLLVRGATFWVISKNHDDEVLNSLLDFCDPFVGYCFTADK